MKVADHGTEPHVDEPEDMEERADRQEHEIEGIRDNLGHLLSELDRRRQRLAPRVLIRAHPVTAAGLGIAVVTAVGGGLVLHSRRVRRQSTLPARLFRLEALLKHTVGSRDRVAKARPSAGGRILVAVSTAIAVAAARQLVKRYLARSK